MLWHKVVLRRLEASGLFSEVGLVGAKVRAVIDEARFLDIHYDPTTKSYSYALIDLGLPYAGDKRLFFLSISLSPPHLVSSAPPPPCSLAPLLPCSVRCLASTAARLNSTNWDSLAWIIRR